ncbi:MAG: immunoglobulin domain-containing protein [Verrucomicrobiota bacterium]
MAQSGVDLADGETISGATTATLTIHPTRPEDAGAYNVVVRGAAPCAPAIRAGAV